MTDRLEYWAKTAPDRVLFAARDAAGAWQTITYSEAVMTMRRIGQGLLGRGLSVKRPVVILSGNCLDHAMLAFACMYIGVPHAPVSPAYSLLSTDHEKLRQIVALLTPGLVFARDGDAFAKAIAAAVPSDTNIVVSHHPDPGRRTISFTDLARTEPTADVEDANHRVGPDTIAKFLFTSGSTGEPKAVINTQRMWCANQQMLQTAIPFFREQPPVVLEWAPWHHTAGGNHEIGIAVYNGGTFYLDEGKPTPAGISATVQNLREIAPTWYFNVPKGFEALLPALRSDKQLRNNFFSQLKVLWFAGAALSQHVFEEMQQLAIDSCGERIHFLTGFGATETAPFALARTWETDKSTNMGLPGAGLELKLAPIDGKFEARVRGVSITPGYWRRQELTDKAFDEEGFYRLGDAFKFDDQNDISRGLLFDGRIAENFKLATGTWVHVGPLRAHFIQHCAPFVRDVIIAGADRNSVTVLICPDLDACRQIPGVKSAQSPADLLTDSIVRAHFYNLLTTLAAKSTGSSNSIRRAILLHETLSLDLGEITDKGSINQRKVLEVRSELVEDLYAANPSERVVSLEKVAG
jgi:feruloyl-CoA synthase